MPLMMYWAFITFAAAFVAIGLLLTLWQKKNVGYLHITTGVILATACTWQVRQNLVESDSQRLFAAVRAYGVAGECPMADHAYNGLLEHAKASHVATVFDVQPLEAGLMYCERLPYVAHTEYIKDKLAQMATARHGVADTDKASHVNELQTALASTIVAAN